MNEFEFDKFADEYKKIVSSCFRVTGENIDYFASYKIYALAALLAERSNDKLRILDFGSGVGTSIEHFRKLMPNSELTCLDVSFKSIEIARNQYPDQANFIVFDGKKIPFSENTFDVMFAACVFHHVPIKIHPALLKESLRVLRPKGHCVIFEHNPFHPLTVRAVNACPLDQNAVLIKAHDLNNKLKQVGFRDVIHRYQLFFPGILKFLRFLDKYLVNLPIGAQYFVVGRK